MAMLPGPNQAGDNESDEGIDTREPPAKSLITLSIDIADVAVSFQIIKSQILKLVIDGVQWKEFLSEQAYPGVPPRVIVKCIIEDYITNEQLIDEIRSLEDYVQNVYVINRNYQLT